MSSDLLKEFGKSEENQWDNVWSHSIANGLGADEDDFGEFEEPERGAKTAEIHTASNEPLAVSSFVPACHSPSQPAFQPHSLAAIEKTVPSNDDDDDWGGFAKHSVIFDTDQVERIGDSNPERNQAPKDKVLAGQAMKVSLLPTDSREVITRTANSASGKPPEPYDFDQDDTWEPMNISQDPTVSAKATTPLSPMPRAKAEPKPKPISSPRSSGPPPSNIPPPSVLLPLVTNLFHSLSIDIKNTITISHVSPSPPETPTQQQIDQIRASLATARAAARILGGRKLRWKRDTLLSQSMKIGPAGKSGGMKLTGVDKTESRREDQEAAEALSAWRKQVGVLRSIISVVNGQLPGSGLVVPDVSENMPIRVVKPSEGAVTAPKCCFLCGIKREERVARVDVDVEDSFGEWWTEHWGHVDCVAFWEKQQSSLKQR